VNNLDPQKRTHRRTLTRERRLCSMRNRMRRCSARAHKTARAGANALDQIGSTNVSSIFWGIHTLRAHGTNAWNFGFPDPVQVFANSQVSVTMTELDNNGTPFLGAATMQIFNVVPQADGTITVKFNVDWSDFLTVQFNFIIAN
jgi:hypothetical protein